MCERHHKSHTPNLIAAITWLRVYVVRPLRPTTKDTSFGKLKYFSQFKGLTGVQPDSIVEPEPSGMDEADPPAPAVSSMVFSLIQLPGIRFFAAPNLRSLTSSPFNRLLVVTTSTHRSRTSQPRWTLVKLRKESQQTG